MIDDSTSNKYGPNSNRVATLSKDYTLISVGRSLLIPIPISDSSKNFKSQ